ncbi:MAG: aminoacyl-tRNA hydrolase [Streptococcaceae bacterium]|jgi:PTH1 family peptidyl-tRNA hydrolase|nr:aminoacyl-tRNA hydrolase [Streptococcaceae bacterium]
MTKMIVGLGNPGERYEATRHNMGFMTIDLLAQELGVTFRMEKSFIAEIAEARVNNEKVFLVKPQTFMNESGRSIKPLMTYYNLDLKDLIVVADDMDSPVGRVRLRQKGSSGGQRGVKSLIVHLGSSEWKRVKIGIGRPKPGWTVVNHVLSRFEGEEAIEAQLGIRKAADALQYYLENDDDFEKTMSKYNG